MVLKSSIPRSYNDELLVRKPFELLSEQFPSWGDLDVSLQNEIIASRDLYNNDGNHVVPIARAECGPGEAPTDKGYFESIAGGQAFSQGFINRSFENVWAVLSP